MIIKKKTKKPLLIRRTAGVSDGCRRLTE